MHVALDEGEHQFADAARCEGVRGDAAGLGVHGASGGEGASEGGCLFGFYSDHLDPPLKPGGDAGDQTAAADGHEKSGDVAGLFLEFEPYGSLTAQSVLLI